LVFEKIGKNRPKRTGDDGGTAKTENTDKSAGFSENRCGNFRADFAQNWPFFLSKIGKLNEKIVKNNNMTSNKFVYVNNT
jgi:hypothetical protein